MLVLTFLITGCSGAQAPQKPAANPTVIGVSVAYPEKEQLKLLRRSMEEKAERDNIKLLWQETEPEKQKDDIKKLLEQDPKALAVFFGSEKDALDISRLAKEKNVPLLALGIMPAHIPLDGFIGLDAHRVGEKQAQFLDKLLQKAKPAKVLILKKPDMAFEEAMTQGNLEVLKGAGGYDVEVREVAPEESVSAVVAGHAYLDEIKGVILHNPLWTEEIVGLLNDLDMSRQVVTVGVGATKNNAQALKMGIHNGEVDVDPEMLGSYVYAALKELAQDGQWHYEEKVVSGDYEVPVKYLPANIISQENIFLLETRYEDLTKEKKEEDALAPKQESQEKQQEENPEEKKNKAKVIIQTLEGQTMEIDVEGGVKKVEIQSGGEKEASEEQQGKEGGQE